MEPEKLLDEILVCTYDRASEPVREYVLAKGTFQEAAANVETSPVESVLKARSVLAGAKGSCPGCGGRSIPMVGTKTPKKHRCLVCSNTFSL